MSVTMKKNANEKKASSQEEEEKTKFITTTRTTTATNGAESTKSSVDDSNSSSIRGNNDNRRRMIVMSGLVMILLVIPLLLVLVHMFDRHLLLQDLSSYTVERMHTNTTFIRRDVPITYYRMGELHKVLPNGGWISNPTDIGLRVFRLYPNEQEEFVIDLTKIRTSLRVKEVIENCPNNHGWIYCPNESCQKNGTGVISGESSDILFNPNDNNNNNNNNESSNSSSSSTMYGSFAEIDNSVVDYLETTMKLPFTLDRGKFEQAFISNFKERLLTTQIHSNPATHSLAVQYAGRKTWLFISADDYLKKDGFHSTSINGPFMPLKAPTVDVMTYWIYKSRPGDLFYFPPHYAHLVSTDPGPNVMINFRKLFPHQILYRPIFFIHAIFNNLFFNKPMPNVTVTPDGKKWDHSNNNNNDNNNSNNEEDGEEENNNNNSNNNSNNNNNVKNLKGPKVAGGTALMMKEYMTTFSKLGCRDDNHDHSADKILAKLLMEAAAE